MKDFCVLSFGFVFVFAFIFFFTLSLLVCGIVDSSQCRRGDLERKEVKQFVKLSCQPLHGGIRPTAKMNKLFQMHGNQRESNTMFLAKNLSFSRVVAIKFLDEWYFAKFFRRQDSIWEMGFVREGPTDQAQQSKALTGFRQSSQRRCIVSLKYITGLYFSALVLNCTVMTRIWFWQKFSADLVSLASNLLKTSGPAKQ